MKNDLNYKHKFKQIFSKNYNNITVINCNSFICLKCDVCFCGCGLRTNELKKPPSSIAFYCENIKNINEESCCIISDDEYMVKQIIE